MMIYCKLSLLQQYCHNQPNLPSAPVAFKLKGQAKIPIPSNAYKINPVRDNIKDTIELNVRKID